jgi:hypothetical protein
VATDGAVEVVGDDVGVESGYHFVMVEFFEEVVDAVDEVDSAADLFHEESTLFSLLASFRLAVCRAGPSRRSSAWGYQYIYINYPQ